MTATIRFRDIKDRNGKTVVEPAKSTYRQKQRSLKANRLAAAWVRLAQKRKEGERDA